MTSYSSRSDAIYDDDEDDLDTQPMSRRMKRSKNSLDDSADTPGSQNGGSTGTSSDEDTPSPRKPSVGKITSKSRDTLTPLKSPDSETSENTYEVFAETTVNGENTEKTMNGEDSLKRRSLIKSNTVASSDAENRRESYGSNRSATETSPRLSQGHSVDRQEWSSSTGVQHNRVARNESISEEEGNELKSASKLRAAWESRAQPEHSKSFSKAKAIGGHTGASTLKARFENPSNQTYQRRASTRKMSRSGSIHDVDGETTKKVSTSALKARFEQKASEAAPAKRNFVINKGKAGEAAKKFNQGSSNSTKCLVCNKSVYPMEKVEVEGLLFHKSCFKCETCKRILGLGNYASLQGKYYCKPHLKQLFHLKGNYDEGFGREQRKTDWVNKGGPTPKSSTPAEAMQQQKFEPSLEPASKPAEPEHPTELEQSDEHDVNGHINGSEADEEPPAEEGIVTGNDMSDDDGNQPEPECAPPSDDEIQNGDVSGEESGDDY